MTTPEQPEIVWEWTPTGELQFDPREKYEPVVFHPDKVAIGIAQNDDMIHRVTEGYVAPAGTPADYRSCPLNAFKTACGQELMGYAVQSILNQVNCRNCWEVPLHSFDSGSVESRIIGARAYGRQRV